MTQTHDPRYRAADGTLVTERMFNYYDGEWVTVEIAGTFADPTNQYHEHWDGWFNTVGETTGRRTPLNGERMAGQPPTWWKDKS